MGQLPVESEARPPVNMCFEFLRTPEGAGTTSLRPCPGGYIQNPDHSGSCASRLRREREARGRATATTTATPAATAAASVELQLSPSPDSCDDTQRWSS